MNRVVIVGAGFAGLSCAKELAGAPAQVTLIDQHNFHTFQPLLYQVATAGLNAADVAYSVRGIFQRQDNVDFRQARVTGIDWERKLLELDSGEQPAVAFDRLVVAAGATAAFFGIDGAAEHSFPLYTLTDSIALRNHLLACFEAADADPALIDDGVLTFVVVGGGPTGVEVAGALAELFAMVLRKDFRHLDVSKAQILLVEMADHLLTPFKPGSQRHARATLEARGVDVRTGATVQRVTPTRVVLAGGEEIPCHTLVWAAGVRANPLADALGVETTRAGRIVVGPDLRIIGHPDAFAVGDVAAVPDAKGKDDDPLPMLAQVAIQSGRHAAREMVRSWRGAPSKPFHYFDKGIMATIGRNAAVAELPGGVALYGVIGWLAWLGLHLIYLVGFRNRLSVLINWGWNYLTWDRGPRLIIAPDHLRRDELPP